MDPDIKPRIVIYGAGQFGQHFTRMAVAKGWPVVAAFNRAGGKVGKDLGELAGLQENLGVPVQDCDEADFSGMEADVGLVAITDRLSNNFAAYERLMNAGMNVLCHGTESYYPWGIDTTLAEAIDALAKRNAVTFTGCGIWDMSRIWAGMMVTAPCTDISSLYHRSITDAQRVGKPLMLVVGVGMSAAEFDEKIGRNPGLVGGLYKTIPHQVLAAIGYTVTRVTERREPVRFDEPIYCRLLERELATGECAGTRIVIEAETAQGVTARADIELRLFRDDEVEHMMWKVDGKPSSSITVQRDDSAYATASSLFNRIPDVVAAPPGIQTLSQLGPMKHTALTGKTPYRKL